MINIFSSLFEALLPRYCYGCKDVLVSGEDVLCTKCLLELTHTFNFLDENNDLADRISINYPVKNAVAFLLYDRQSLESRLIHSFKYNDDLVIGKFLTKLFCTQLKQRDWINNIDYIIPLPLHWRRKLHRGYNQSEIISREIGKYFEIKVKTNCIKRVRYNKSQTKMTKEKRWENVKDIFAVKNTKQLEGKHILLVDDIATTGASLNFCIKALSTIKDINISVLVIASTQK